MTPAIPDDLKSTLRQLVELLQQNRWAEAAYFASLARRRFPLAHDLIRLHGIALIRCQRRDEARMALYRATELAPQDTEAHCNLAILALESGQAAQAETHARKVLQQTPERGAAHVLLAHALGAQGRWHEAAAAWSQAERHDPTKASKHAYQTGLLLDAAGDLAGAIDAWRRALRHDPQLTPALGQLLFAQRRCCDWRGLDALTAQLRERVAGRQPGINPFAFLAEDADAGEQRRCAETCASAIAERTAPLRRTLELRHVVPSAHAPIRIGFVADGFGEHIIGLSIVALLEALAERGLELHLFATTPDDGSPLRRRLAAAATVHELSGLAAAPAAQRIHQAGIEVLFDLNGYCGRDNAELLSLRPAPLQVGWLGYPGSSGAPWMDYLLADAVVLPDALRPHVSEKLLRLPRCHQPNDPSRAIPAPPSREACGLPAEGTVFACFNSSYKLNPAAFARFMLILQQVPGSVLWLLEGPDGAAQRLRTAAATLGVAPQRLVFLPPQSPAGYLARYAHADLCLDTLPYNAHTPVMDALWSGCPVLTLRGETFAGRLTASLLHHAGLPELVAVDEDGFIDTAVQLGTDPQARAVLRRYLARQRRTGPLFDMHGFARDFHRTVQWISTRYRMGRPPADSDL